MNSSHSQRAFAMFDIVMVAAFLIVVGTLLLPVVMSRTYCGPVSQVKNNARQIATALNAYLSEYGKLPEPPSGNANSAKLMNTLAGTLPNDPDNPRKIIFLDVPKAKNHHNGVEMSGDHGPFLSGYKDPWGNEYEIRIDPVATSVDGPDGPVAKPVIVWSRGDPAKTRDYEDKIRWVKSWE